MGTSGQRQQLMKSEEQYNFRFRLQLQSSNQDHTFPLNIILRPAAFQYQFQPANSKELRIAMVHMT